MLSSEHVPMFIKKNKAEIFKSIQVIDTANFLEPSSFLENQKIDYFIHSAGLTNNRSENSSGNHRNYYEASKHASEKFLLKACKEKEMPIQILRPSLRRCYKN